jgi:hypothetical protein
MGRAFGANGKSKNKGHARAKAPFFLVGVYRGLKPAAPPVRQVQVQKQRQPQKQIPCGNDRKKGKNGSALRVREVGSSLCWLWALVGRGGRISVMLGSGAKTMMVLVR